MGGKYGPSREFLEASPPMNKPIKKRKQQVSWGSGGLISCTAHYRLFSSKQTAGVPRIFQPVNVARVLLTHYNSLLSF